MEILGSSKSEQHQKFCLTAKSLPYAAAFKNPALTVNTKHWDLPLEEINKGLHNKRLLPGPNNTTPHQLYSARESFKSFLFS